MEFAKCVFMWAGCENKSLTRRKHSFSLLWKQSQGSASWWDVRPDAGISGWTGEGQVVMDRWVAGLSRARGQTEEHGRAD